MDTSNVPPPRSTTMIVCSVSGVTSYAQGGRGRCMPRAAAVGSFTKRTASMFAICAASFNAICSSCSRSSRLASAKNDSISRRTALPSRSATT
jgi:hypothetical protein